MYKDYVKIYSRGVAGGRQVNRIGPNPVIRVTLNGDVDAFVRKGFCKRSIKLADRFCQVEVD